MSLLLLVRHGQASWGTADYDRLSPLGHEQSRVLGQALAARGVRPDLVVRGGMRRHRETATAVAAGGGWHAEATEDRGWDEFDHQQMLSLHPAGPQDGDDLTRAEFQRWFEEAVVRWTGGDFADEYGESFSAFGDRVQAALRRTVDRLGPQQTGLVLTSGGPISWVVASMLGGAAEVWSRLNPVTVNASVTKVVVGRRGATLVSFNDHSHLERDGLLTYR